LRRKRGCNQQFVFIKLVVKLFIIKLFVQLILKLLGLRK
jgi:hypothetical protein